MLRDHLGITEAIYIARELWSKSWHIADHRNLMSGKTSFGPIITAELTDGAEMQQYSHIHFCLLAGTNWCVRSLPVNSLDFYRCKCQMEVICVTVRITELEKGDRKTW